MERPWVFCWHDRHGHDWGVNLSCHVSEDEAQAAFAVLVANKSQEEDYIPKSYRRSLAPLLVDDDDALIEGRAFPFWTFLRLCVALRATDHYQGWTYELAKKAWEEGGSEELAFAYRIVDLRDHQGGPPWTAIS